MGGGRRLYGIWICFALRLLFYATALPLWEGYDEWAHFSVIRIMASRGVALVPRDAPVPRDVAASLDLAPVPWELRHLTTTAVTQDAFWKLPPEERSRREAVFRELPRQWRTEDSPPFLTAYEALQPPLYYWLMAPLLRLANSLTLGAQVMLLRWLAAILTSLAIPLLYGVALDIFGDTDVALACAAVAALMPEWALDVARVGNDGLSVLLFTLLIWIGLKMIEEGLRARWSVALGAVLGLGLLTKAWFLTALPAILLLYVWLTPRGAGTRACRAETRLDALLSGRLCQAVLTFLIAAAISAWWYVHNLFTNGTLTGLSESVTLRHTGIAAMAGGAVQVPWLKAIDSILLSHLYFGGWSSLTVRAWMYHLFYAIILAAAVGVFRAARRPPMLWLLAIYLVFWLGQLYNVVLIFMSKAVPTSMGWYLYAVVAAEVTVCVAGLRAILPKRAGNVPLAAGVLLFGLFDLYTLEAVAIPYYTGMTAHSASGALAAVHWHDLRTAGLGTIFRRLAIFKGAAVVWPVLAALWILYLLATLWLMLEGAHWAAPGRRRDILR